MHRPLDQKRRRTIMSFVRGLRCIDCGKEYPAKDLMTACPECGKKGLFYGLLDPVYDYDKIAQEVNKDVLEKREATLWKYKEFMPISDESKIVSMGEGGTPLIRAANLASEFGIDNLYLKNETVNPTFSFKDRPCSLIVSKVLEEGVRAVGLMSDGNNGVSAAAYCAKAGIECYVFMPASSVPDKVTHVLLHGAKVILVQGFAYDAGMLSMQACAKYGWTNISQIKPLNPYPTEAHRSTSYEVCEQLGWKAPDWLLTPVASGDSIGGQWKGYKEFHQLGFVGNRPRMVAVQGEGADPVVRAFRENKEWFEVEPFEPQTISDALAAGNVVGSWALNSLRESNGEAVAVSDEETLDAQKLLAESEGIFVEPSSAVPIVGLEKLIDQGVIDKSETIVCVLTGSGLKVMEVAERLVKKPVSIKPTIEALDEALGLVK
jgi:threonine synthase